MTLSEEFVEIRKKRTPWCAVRTPDYREVVKTLSGVAQGVAKSLGRPDPIIAVWTCTSGNVSQGGGALGDPQDPPFMAIKAALENLPAEAVYFFVVPDQTLYDNPFTVQALADCRDRFKADGRTLVLVGVSHKLPEFLIEDVPVLDDPLPEETDLRALVSELAEGNGVKLAREERDKAANLCLGLNKFAAEEAVSRKLRKGGVNLQGLMEARRRIVEDSTGGALRFEKEPWNFDNMGGMSAFKGFMSALFGGPKEPAVVLRWDEIDKSISAASTGAVADNTGVSQEFLRGWLTAIEDNGWMGLLAVGGPGVGKTLSSICTGNQFGKPTLSFDSSSTKSSLVGSSEAANRRVIDVLKSIGGNRVLIIATANRLDTLPPELQRRFWLGTWFWDLPTAEERKAIWAIQRKRFGIGAADREPQDEGWTGSDVRNCCQMAWVTRSTLKEAAERITIAGITSKTQIDALRVLAEGSGFRCANKVGAYKREKNAAPRRVAGIV